MGQKNSKEKEVDISLDHPKFKNAKLLSGDGQRITSLVLLSYHFLKVPRWL